MLECIFSVFILGVISSTVFYSIFTFSKFQKISQKKIDYFNQIENTIEIIKNNIKSDKNALEDINPMNYDIQIKNYDDLYKIKLKSKIQGQIKEYEIYITKNK